MRRMAAAMLDSPPLRSNPSTTFRKAAITWGAAPLLTWDASSPRVTSRT